MREWHKWWIDASLTDPLARAIGAPTAFHMNMSPAEHVAYLARLITRQLGEDEIRSEEAIARERAKSRALARALLDQEREEDLYDFHGR